MGKLKDKVAVITGATSGMALATAKLFVEEGAYVFITGRRQKKLDDAVKAIGRNVTGVQGDASNLADLDRLYETVKKEKGRIDVLFASAGTGEFAPIGEVTEEQFDKTFGLNVRGTLFTVQKALPLFSDGGSIIMNGSIAGSMGFPAFGVYSASKAAVRSFARTWTVDLKARNIRVNVLSPGTIDTADPRRRAEGCRRRVRRADPPGHDGPAGRDRDRGASSWRRAIPASSPGSSCSSTAASPRSDDSQSRTRHVHERDLAGGIMSASMPISPAHRTSARRSPGLSREQLVSRPVPGKWSVLEVVCHLADTDANIAHRIKRVLSEERPTFERVKPDLMLAALAYHDARCRGGTRGLRCHAPADRAHPERSPPEAWERTGDRG